ncbi:MAG: SprT-like domain-containing protein [Bacteroidota bacterium]
MTPEKAYTILQQHVPSPAVEYCFNLWRDAPFELKLAKSRRSKVGDFTSQSSRHPRITLNNDLNPYQFLVTYIHEVAHLHVFLQYRNKVDPHGKEWKNTFKQLMHPMLRKTVFPDEILHELVRHMMNPMASSYTDSNLTRALRAFDKNADKFVALSDLPEGSLFEFHGRFFKKGQIKRTRILCREVRSRRNYYVPADALVSNVQLSLL